MKGTSSIELIQSNEGTIMTEYIEYTEGTNSIDLI